MNFKTLFILLTLLSVSACSSMKKHHKHKKVKVEKQTVEYSTSKTQLEGVLYKPATKRSKGGILVVHEWYGLNDYAKMRAKKLAQMGYTTFAVDMYGKGKTSEHPKDAKKFMEASLKDPAELKAKFEAAMEVLTQEGGASKDKIVAVGYCFGGGIALGMARAGLNLSGVASFHGSLATAPEQRAKKGDIKAKLLVANGGADPMAPNSDVTAFMKEMHNAEVDMTFMNFKGALHSFTAKNADEKAKKYDLPIGYDKNADKQSWYALKKFLKITL